jgi:hypothetical protein
MSDIHLKSVQHRVQSQRTVGALAWRVKMRCPYTLSPFTLSLVILYPVTLSPVTLSPGHFVPRITLSPVTLSPGHFVHRSFCPRSLCPPVTKIKKIIFLLSNLLMAYVALK